MAGRGGNDAELPPVVLLSLTGDFSPPDDKFEYELLQSLYAAGAEEDMIGDFCGMRRSKGPGYLLPKRSHQR